MNKIFKSLILTASLSSALVATASHADQASIEEQAVAVKRQYRNLFRSMNGFNMIGVGSCENVVPAELCLRVGFESQDSLMRAEAVLGSTFVLDGIPVILLNVGPIDPQPGVTVHN